MQDNTSTLSVGIDLGTSRVRVVVGQKDQDNAFSIVGLGQAEVNGMRKGSIVDLNGPAKAIDEALAEAERMSGLQLDRASINVNGASILSTSASGMVAVASGEVSQDDLYRVEDVAKVGKIPANRSVLSVVPHDYVLDGQADIKDPIGMLGSRLEMVASMVSVLSPHLQNIHKLAELLHFNVSSIIPSPVAAAKAVLSEAERENGVMLVDFGASTTGLAIYEDGDLKHVAVLPVGSNNLTNDLAIGLQTTPDIAELIKLGYADAMETNRDKQVSIKHDKINHEFNLSIVDEVVNARLEELFESVAEQLKKSGYAGKLPNGVVLVGGGANLKRLAEFVKMKLGLAARVALPLGFKGLADKVELPEMATALGLMLLDEANATHAFHTQTRKIGFLTKLLAGFKTKV